MYKALWTSPVVTFYSIYSTSQEMWSWFMFCCVLAVNRPILPIFSVLFHWHWGQSYDCPSASEVTLKNVGERITRIHQEQIRSPNTTNHISWDILRSA